MPEHPKETLLVAAALERLVLHMHSFNPSTQASAAMSAAKADGKFYDRLEPAFRHVVTNFGASTTLVDLLTEALALDP